MDWTDRYPKEPMECGYLGCTIASSSVRSYSIGWTANLSPVQWISGGFAVQATIETGNEYSCPGGPYDYLAVWKKIGQTAYTIQNALFNACTGTRPNGASFVMWSPNQNNRGGNFYCVYSRQYVRAIGDRYTDTSPQWPGGP